MIGLILLAACSAPAQPAPLPPTFKVHPVEGTVRTQIVMTDDCGELLRIFEAAKDRRVTDRSDDGAVVTMTMAADRMIELECNG